MSILFQSGSFMRSGRTVIATSLATVAVLGVTFYAHANSTGMFGATRRDSSVGCGASGCHTSTPSNNTSVSITGAPATFEPGQTYTLFANVKNAVQVGAGIDIAVAFGELAPANDSLYAFGTELTHRRAKKISGGVATWPFKYTVPTTGTTDTIYATGNAANMNGQNTGDQWNFAPKFVVNIGSAGVESETSRPIALSVAPNPVRQDRTTVTMNFHKQGHVTLVVIDAAGRIVEDLAQGPVSAGLRNFEVRTADLAPGIYTVKAINDQEVVGIGRFIVVR